MRNIWNFEKFAYFYQRLIENLNKIITKLIYMQKIVIKTIFDLKFDLRDKQNKLNDEYKIDI